MQLLTWLSSLLLLAPSPAVAANSANFGNAMRVFKRAEKHHAAIVEKRNSLHEPFQHQELQKRASSFLNNVTEKFVVNGSAIPNVTWDVGESYAGLLPISGDPNETRKLFFWFFPTINENPAEEITIWLNGGPGCSSLSGLLTENGPFTWEAGTLEPTANPYSWHNLTNMLWVEQPVGVGFSQGVPNITNEVELGQEFIGFYKQFVEAFDVHGWDVYVTGESYAGYYVPYIADAFLTANDTDYYNLKGIAINDPIIGDGTIQQEVPVVPFLNYWADLFFLNDTFTAAIQEKSDKCGFTAYQEKYLTFPPPPGPFPLLPTPSEANNYRCDLWDDVYAAVLLSNPCFNIYHITETCPHPYSVLGIVNSGDYSPPDATVYFNRTDVQAAINAPVGTYWEQCSSTNVFGLGTQNESLGDTSLGPALDGVLQRVIEATNNVIIGSGNLDYILPTNGTLLALQNLTWNGVQGFQTPPTQPFYVPYHPEYNAGALSAAGVVGGWTAERGLTFYWVQLAGHELPGYAPGAGYRQLELLLGRVANLSQEGDFTTQSGNYTGSSTIYKRAEMEEGVHARVIRGAGPVGLSGVW